MAESETITEPALPSAAANLPARSAGRKTSETIEAYIASALRAWGGPKAFGMTIRAEFANCKLGSPQRVRLLDMMLTFLKMQHSLLPRRDEAVGGMSDEELQAELHELLAAGEPDDYPEGPAEEPAEPADE